MKNYNQTNRSNRGGNRDYNRRDSGRPPMHQAVCDKCGQDCEVPFRPTAGKPVYCSDCFKKIEPRQSESRSFQRSSFNDKPMHQAVCDKCGQDCEVPFRPTKGKPIYCDNCFVKDERRGSKNNDQFKEQFTLLNTKLDEILKTLTVNKTKTEPKKEATIETKKETKPKKETAKKKTTKKK